MSDDRESGHHLGHPADSLAGDYPDIDHLAHFLPDIERASAALIELGFTLTPFSAQSHRLEPGGPLVPAGTGNRCIMLKRGYLEFLTPTHDTPNAEQLRIAIRRYTGVHLIAFGTQTPEVDFQRLTTEGFASLTPVTLQRQAATESGEATARFTVVRVAPAAMAEGRIQFCQHHTRNVVWQPRWITHANHAVGLAGVILCVADPAEAAQRYARFTGLRALSEGSAWRINATRGYLLFVAPDAFERWLGIVPPAMPWIAGYVLSSDDIIATGEFLRRAQCDVRMIDSHRLLVKLPSSVGGIAIFEASGSRALSIS